MSLDTENEVEPALRVRVRELEHRTAVLIAVLRLLLALLRAQEPAAPCSAPSLASVGSALDGTKAYLRAVIDSYSRRILAWTVADRLDPMNSRDVLVRAARDLERSTTAEVYMDSDAENLNAGVDELFLDGTVRKLVELYVTERNEQMPHSAFDGQTPDEMYLGRGAGIPDELAARRHEARKRRLEHNRKQACEQCPRLSP